MAKIKTNNQKLLKKIALLQDKQLVRSLKSFGFEKSKSVPDAYGLMIVTPKYRVSIVVTYSLYISTCFDSKQVHNNQYATTQEVAEQVSKILDSIEF